MRCFQETWYISEGSAECWKKLSTDQLAPVGPTYAGNLSSAGTAYPDAYLGPQHILGGAA